MILSRKEVLDAIRKWEDNNPDYNLSLEQEQRVIDYYDKVKNETVNIDKTKPELEKVISKMTNGIVMGQKEEYIVGYHTDNRKLYTFSVMLAPGETEKITDALLSNGVPTSVLTGLTFQKDYSNDYSTPAGNVHVEYHIDKESPDSPPPRDLVITLNGKTIYHFYGTKETFSLLPSTEDYASDEFEEGFDYELYDLELEWRKTHNVQVSKHIDFVRSNEDFDVVAEKIITRNGKYMYRDPITKKFLSKNDFDED